MKQKQETCEQRIEEHQESRLDDLRRFQASGWDEAQLSDDDYAMPFNEYGLSWDYVESDTEDRPGYWRYQISCGGPAEELRFYCDQAGHVWTIEFVFLDWSDHAKRTLQGDDRKLGQEIWDYFNEIGMCEVE